MQIKKMARKIAAIGTGALMLGATLTGALAASNDLANYPAPFVKNGVLDNTVIVVGKTAETADVLGAIDIAAALQAAAVSPVQLATTTSVAPDIDNGVKIDKSGNKFNYEEDAEDIIPEGLSEIDLPEVLLKGSFRDTKGANRATRDYTQSLKMLDGSVIFNLYQPDDSDNYPDGRPGDNYVYLPYGQGIYNYSLSFSTAVTYDTTAISTDLEGNTIKLQGNTYTITEATGDSSGKLTKLKLVAGDSTFWLTQDQPYTIGEHTVTVVNVDQGATKCGVNVDGVTVWVDVGTTQQFGDLSVGVLQAVAVHTKDYDADTCELTLGSSETVLEDGETVKVNDEELEGSLVTFYGEAGSWEGFSVTYTGGYDDKGINQAEIYLKAGEAWTDPVFGNWKVLFAGTTATTEDMKLERLAKDKARFTYTNYGGKNVDIYWVSNGTNIFLGEDLTRRVMLLPGESRTGVNPERTRFLYTTSGGETHVLELDKVYELTGSSANTTTIKDLTYDNVIVADKRPFTPGKETEIPLSGLGSITLNMTAGDSGYVYWIAGGTGTPKTKLGATLSFTDYNITITEQDVVEVSANVIALPMVYSPSSSNDRIEFQTPVGLNVTVNKDKDDTDNQIGVTMKGTMLKWNEDRKHLVEISYPEKDVFANVFVAPLEASVIGGGVSSGAEKVNPFSVGLAVLDEEAEKMTKNMIVVGGPCVNTIAASLMDNPASCAEGFEPGKAMIKFFDWKGKAALLVAGYEAKDTMGASYVLADAAKYTLSGDEVEVVVTSLDQITVNKV